MSNQNKKTQIHTTLLTLALATIGFMSIANAENTELAQNDAQATEVEVTGVDSTEAIVDESVDAVEDEEATDEAAPEGEPEVK